MRGLRITNTIDNAAELYICYWKISSGKYVFASTVQGARSGAVATTQSGVNLSFPVGKPLYWKAKSVGSPQTTYWYASWDTFVSEGGDQNAITHEVMAFGLNKAGDIPEFMHTVSVGASSADLTIVLQ